MFQCCIFDLDGTLINSLEDLADACNWVLRENGLPTHPVDAYRRFVGDGAYKLAERMLPESMRDQQTAARYKALFDQRYNGHYLDKTRPYAGIPELLARLKEQGVTLAVYSNKADGFSREIVEHYFPGVFQLVRGHIKGTPVKPDPAGIHALLADLAVRPEETLFGGVHAQGAQGSGNEDSQHGHRQHVHQHPGGIQGAGSLLVRILQGLGEGQQVHSEQDEEFDILLGVDEPIADHCAGLL